MGDAAADVDDGLSFLEASVTGRIDEKKKKERIRDMYAEIEAKSVHQPQLLASLATQAKRALSQPTEKKQFDALDRIFSRHLTKGEEAPWAQEEGA